MAGKSVTKLLLEASDAIGHTPASKAPTILEKAGKRGDELWALLQERNGFYAFESALHVFPASGPGTQSLERWNSPELWRDRYQEMAKGCLFFAEDIFGGQFAILDNAICTFDPETGETEQIGATMEAWARAILDEYETLTGQPLANEWQQAHGPLARGKRLLPKTPFVTGGEFTLPNLYAADAVKGMQFRGDLAVQIRDLPDGAEIKFKIVE